MALREILLKLDIDVKGEKKATSTLDKLKKSAKGFGAVFITGAVALGFRKMINDASEASETANKFAAVFGEAADTTTESVDDISKRTGASTLQLQQFTAQIGALVKPALGSSEAAGKMGTSISELALDVASFNDVSPEEALGALRSGLIGSAEPLQRFGVDIRQTSGAMEAQAKAMGKTFKQLTESEKVMARFAVISKQLGSQGALGDAEKTADGFANASRALAGRVTELSAEVGGVFLPIAQKLVVALRDNITGVIDWVKANKEWLRQDVARVVRTLKDILVGLARFIGIVVEGWLAWATVLAFGNKKMAILLTIVGALVAILGLPVVLLLAIGAAIFLIIDDFITMGEGGESMIGTLIAGFSDLIDELGGFGAAWNEIWLNAFEFVLVSFAKMFGASEETANKIGQVFRDVWDATIGFMGRAFDMFIETNLGFIRDAAGLFGGSSIGGGSSTVSAPSRSGGGGGSVSSNVEIKVDASGVSDPAAVADMVSKRVDSVMEQRNRQAAQSYLASPAG